jgi:preprotein translocase subunit SecF
MIEWIKPGTSIDFIGGRRTWLRASAFAVGASLVVLLLNLLFRGSTLNYGNDFKGGSELQVEFAKDVDPAAVRAALAAHGFGEAEVVRVKDEARPHFYLVRVGEVSAYSRDQIERARKSLADRFKDEGLKRLDFSEGGDKLFVRFGKTVPGDALDAGLRAAGISPQSVEPFGRPEDHAWQVTLVGLDHEMRSAFENGLGAGAVKDIPQIESVGAKVGAQLRADGIRSVLYTLILMLLYIAVRFNFEFAPGAVVALAHDVIIVVGIFALLWKEFTLQTVAALLTVGGYSINDTIVVFDRIRENATRLRDRRLPELVNASINETLSRTTLTALTTLFTTAAVWYFVRGPVRDFALAMTIGIAVGTYSSIFVASPLYILLHERFSRGAKPT